jgi:hypothetical protein
MTRETTVIRDEDDQLASMHDLGRRLVAFRLAVRIEEVVRIARLQRELTDGNAQPFAQVDGVGILNDPTSIPKVLDNQDTGFFFGGHVAEA